MRHLRLNAYLNYPKASCGGQAELAGPEINSGIPDLYRINPKIPNQVGNDDSLRIVEFFNKHKINFC